MSNRVERVETLVIGGGQAGLAVGQQLAERDQDFVIIEAGARVGDAWRNRWGSLRLFTPAAYNGLPGMPFPAPSWHLPDKDEVADYLERYAERFELPVRLETRVETLTRVGERFVAHTSKGVFESETVVVATGPFQTPNVPSIAARLEPTIHQLHSSDYRGPFDVPDGSVLVVGAGNSGAQIAIELAKFRKVWLAGRETGHLPRRVMGRDFFAWSWPIMSKASVDTRVGRRLRERTRRGGDPLIGITRRDLAAAGVVRVDRLTADRRGLPVCGNEVLEPRVIVWCTGFKPDYAWIDLPITDEDGFPRHARGVATDIDGLFFVGLRFQQRLTSSLLGGVGADARSIASQTGHRAESLAMR
jgi:putative flavoprotein involved in K+ transport